MSADPSAAPTATLGAAPSSSPAHVRAELSRPDLEEHAEALGFRGPDLPDLVAAARGVLERPADLAVVEQAARRLLDRIGDLPARDGDDVWEGVEVGEDGVLAVLALLATAPALAAFHASRGVPADVSAATVADLGQQVWVHRLVSGRFGLYSYAWETGWVWSGALYRLGRLQFSVEEGTTVDGSGRELVCSTHIPRGAALRDADVDAALAAAQPFFARHFPELGPLDLHCVSWMLDPRLPRLLPGSNLARFQRRWRTYGERREADEDAFFFAFARRGRPEVDRLVAETSLQRAILSVWRSGEHWHLVEGRLAAPAGTRNDGEV
ncbi:acyltransferase domain-containing protein [Microlunatus flavus]|uniref:GNAT-like C-terminal domain-containing protein n=1 Tax=Microlunatus flavus TaxID=1036181 RepID=A0A1H9ASS8_9ACTN|nr:acyltransferase domain-containing protein [Microlunatus flavus]SEP79463.1 hypothetical protein SAMN05421756_101710 [Microlunatus flavus]